MYYCNYKSACILGIAAYRDCLPRVDKETLTKATNQERREHGMLYFLN